MKVAKDLTEFYYLNDKDVNKILLKYFKTVLKYHDLEDIKSEIYERLHKTNYIQKFRPLEIQIDIENRKWEIKPNYAKFSTYICKFIFNYIYAYYNKIKPDRLCLSLDDYNDSFYNEEDNKSLHPLDVDVEDSCEMINTELRIEIERVLNVLEKKTKYKGTLVCDCVEDNNIARAIDKQGCLGCGEEEILELAYQKKIKRSEMTRLEQILFDKKISKIEEKGIIRIELDEEGKKRYFINDPERRSLYKLFKYYLEGYRDKEISEKFNMTVAGVGAMKRSLRKEIKDIKNY